MSPDISTKSKVTFFESDVSLTLMTQFGLQTPKHYQRLAFVLVSSDYWYRVE